MQRVPSFLFGLTLLSGSFGMMAQPGTTPSSSTATEATPLSSSDEAESYDIYSAVLQEKGPGPAVADWRIVRETRAFQMCLQPARDQDSIYRPMIDDYALKNKKTVVLQRKFKLSAYALVGPEAWASAQSSKLAVLSAVGFNRDRTRALLCFWANASGTCSFMVKQETRWQIDRSWRGTACGWAN
jgi:hypothetical protein